MSFESFDYNEVLKLVLQLGSLFIIACMMIYVGLSYLKSAFKR